MAPIISSTIRTSETSAIVTFSVPPSEQDAEYLEILLYSADNGKRFNEVCMLTYYSTEIILSQSLMIQTLLSNMVRTNDLQMTFNSLDPCIAYYVQVSAVTCGTRITSDAMLIDLLDSSALSINLSLDDSITTCNAWVASNTNSKIMDVENHLRVISLQRCTAIPCLTYSSLTCVDSTKVNFR